MTCVMPMLVNKGSTSTKEERKTMVDTFLCGASKNTRRIIIKFMTMPNSIVGGGIDKCTYGSKYPFQK